ncbi:hypothetical protein HFP89_04870 [Wenzhouxiangella sp. XN79A]|uniref:ATP-binding protein n=1 Tax=Wenzhouxiangella sp. XN79A TaxID=2724193 RepID=UPI00144A6AAE|nr:ATP-binding protein [Wenzhouxiangella sp. XN79A]NKI34495.1 hypothetical protein [Wenzhouxiangella sp. XN79A]
MRLRGQLVLAALIVALLPVTAVLFLNPIERLLRAGHEQAVGAAARAAAGLLAADAPIVDGPVARDVPVLYLHPGLGTRIVDGYADDWLPAIDRVVTLDGRRAGSAPAAALESHPAPVRLAAIRDGRTLELFLRVADASPRFAQDGARPGDALTLELTDGDGQRRFELAPTAPGPLALRDRYGRLLRAHWQDRPDGWSLELRVPIDRPLTAVSVAVTDRGGDGREPTRHDSGPMRPVGRDPEAQLRLDRLAVGAAWWLDRAGWVRAHARGPTSGSLAPTATGDSGVLDFLMAARLDPIEAWSDRSARLDADWLSAVVDGAEAAAWGRVGPERAIRLRYAVPVGEQGVLVLERDAGPLLLLANRAVLSWLGASLAVFMLIALLLFGFVLVLALRIRRLRNAAERAVGDTGRLDELPAASTARDELGDLSRGLRDVLQRLREHQRYLQSLADSLAHELRTPVSMVQSSLDNLHDAGEDERAVYLQRAEQGAQRLRSIVRAMSQAARLEESLEREALRPMDLAGLIGDYAAARAAAEPDHRLEAELGGLARAPIDGAEDLLAQLLDKVVDNAVAFTPSGGRIVLRLAADGPCWRLEIENQGPSIDLDRAATVFDSMVTFRNGARAGDDAPHLGLGLYVARCIVRFHGGRIAARPVPGGTVIEIELPARHATMGEA